MKYSKFLTKHQEAGIQHNRRDSPDAGMHISDSSSYRSTSTNSPWGSSWHLHYGDTHNHFPEKSSYKSTMLEIIKANRILWLELNLINFLAHQQEKKRRNNKQNLENTVKKLIASTKQNVKILLLLPYK